jgi:hypothetical protein
MPELIEDSAIRLVSDLFECATSTPTNTSLALHARIFGAARELEFCAGDSDSGLNPHLMMQFEPAF